MPRLIALTPLLPPPLPAPDAAQEQPLAAGTKAGHLDVGGLTVDEAIVKLQQSYNAALGRPLSVQVAGRRFRLTMPKAKLSFDAPLTARRALRKPGADVPLAITWDRKLVRKLSERIARTVYLAPRNATVRITLRHMIREHSRSGRSLNAKALRRSIEAVLGNPDPASSRIIRPARKVLHATITANR